MGLMCVLEKKIPIRIQFQTGFDFKSCLSTVISFILIFHSLHLVGESLRSAQDSAVMPDACMHIAGIWPANISAAGLWKPNSFRGSVAGVCYRRTVGIQKEIKGTIRARSDARIAVPYNRW